MKAFMDQDFLLRTPTARTLYHQYAKDMPLYDYHCHLSPKEIAEDKRYRNITEVWLGGDHYKWRAMRSNGVDERFITGDAPDREKFQKWAETMPACIGNPLYHWTHLELRRFFGIHTLLGPDTAEEIWQACNARLQEPDFSARGLIVRSNVRALCTTDDPTDTLEYHQQLSKDASFPVSVTPTFRPDKGINIDKDGFREWLGKLSAVSGITVSSFETLKAALSQRLDAFAAVGGKLSDHALDPIVFEAGTEADADRVLRNFLTGGCLTATEVAVYKTQVLLFCGREYARRGWVMQLHMGTIRNNSTRMMRLLGPDTGFDAIGDYTYAQNLSRFLDVLDDTDELPKTILYTLNPRDNEVLGTLMGCFQGGGIPGKIQFGSGWWFNDQKDGMIRQMVALANLGLLPRFVGMLTDSRSFLSYTRHEYFRRILCDLLGTWAEDGELPADTALLGQVVQDICWNNAAAYFA